MKRWMSLLAATAAIVSLIGGAGCKDDASQVASDGSSAEKGPVAVKTRELKPTSYREYGEYFGTVEAHKEATLVAHAGGTVDRIRVQSGDEVKAGRHLCDVDGDQWDSSYESAQIAEQVARQKYERNQVHLKNGSVSRMAVNQSKLEYLNAKSQRINTAKKRRGALCIAPFAGTVTAVHVDLYEHLPPEAKTMTLADLSKVNLEVGIPESDIAGYKVGRPATVTMTGFPDQSWEGEIRSIDQSVNEQSRDFRVDVAVENPKKLLKPGMTAKARILRYDLKDRLVVPNDVILTDESTRYVMTTDGKKAFKRPVLVESSNETHSLIGDGLSAGVQLIVKGHARAEAGGRVNVVGQEKTKDPSS